MNIYIVTRPGETSYEEYVGAVVIALSPTAAKRIHPAGGSNVDGTEQGWSKSFVAPDKVEVEYLGKAAANSKPGVVLASFHNG